MRNPDWRIFLLGMINMTTVSKSGDNNFNTRAFGGIILDKNFSLPSTEAHEHRPKTQMLLDVMWTVVGNISRFWNHLPHSNFRQGNFGHPTESMLQTHVMRKSKITQKRSISITLYNVTLSMISFLFHHKGLVSSQYSTKLSRIALRYCVTLL